MFLDVNFFILRCLTPLQSWECMQHTACRSPCLCLISCASEQQGDMRQKHVFFIHAPVYQSNIASSDVVIVFILPRTRTSSSSSSSLAQDGWLHTDDLLHTDDFVFCCVPNLWFWLLTSTLVSVQGKTHCLSGPNQHSIITLWDSAPNSRLLSEHLPPIFVFLGNIWAGTAVHLFIFIF